MSETVERKAAKTSLLAVLPALIGVFIGDVSLFTLMSLMLFSVVVTGLGQNIDAARENHD